MLVDHGIVGAWYNEKWFQLAWDRLTKNLHIAAKADNYCHGNMGS